jgi:hypothetical protein
MTRVNVIDPKELTTKHLVAEYREIARLPENLRKSLNRKGKPFKMSEIPISYTLGTGHVKFFYNKMEFLKKRFLSLVEEMERRGYNPQFKDGSIFEGFDDIFVNDYIPTQEAININVARIKERLDAKNNS